MRPVTLSVKDCRELDRRADQEFGIPTLLLMESAGRGLAKTIQAALIPPTQVCQVLFLCGTGNNGGDAFVAARHLLQRGQPSRVFLVGDPASLRAEAAVNYRIITKIGVPTAPFSAFQEMRKEWDRKPVVLVDAILGTGIAFPLRPAALEAIRQLNDFRKNHNSTVRVIAVDIPSGLDGDKGVVQPDTVQANMTVTFACYKPGLLRPESHAYAGRVEVADIGIPEKLMRSVAGGN